jgi:hypothetical protein
MNLQKCFRIIICTLTLMLVICCATSTPSTAAATSDETLSLTVTIKSRHIDYFEFCVPIRVEEPFQIVWGNDKVKDSFSGVLHAPKEGKYPLRINISEGGGSCREMTEPSLSLDQPEEWTNVVSSAFQHYDSRKLILSKARCQQPSAEPAPAADSRK